LHRELKLGIDVARVRPPYVSAWPDDLPSKEELEKKYNTWPGERSDEEIAQSDIFHSVMGSEDFARYVIGTNSGHFDWTCRRLHKARNLPAKKAMNSLWLHSQPGSEPHSKN